MPKTLIRCEKCSSTNVKDVLFEEPKVIVLTMDEYIEKNKSRGVTHFIEGDMLLGRTEKRLLICSDCGYQRAWDQVVHH